MDSYIFNHWRNIFIENFCFIFLSRIFNNIDKHISIVNIIVIIQYTSDHNIYNIIIAVFKKRTVEFVLKKIINYIQYMNCNYSYNI